MFQKIINNFLFLNLTLFEIIIFCVVIVRYSAHWLLRYLEGKFVFILGINLQRIILIAYTKAFPYV